MPQMSSMNWTLLMIFVLFNYLILMIYLYFNLNYYLITNKGLLKFMKINKMKLFWI